MKRFLNEKTGSAYIELMVHMLVLFTILAFIIAILPILFAKAKVSDYADNIMRIAEISGTTNYSEINDKVQELNNEFGNTATLDWTGTDYYTGSKVQLGDDIKLEVSIPYTIEGLSFLNTNTNFVIKAKSTGMSEVYWRN